MQENLVCKVDINKAMRTIFKTDPMNLNSKSRNNESFNKYHTDAVSDKIFVH